MRFRAGLKSELVVDGGPARFMRVPAAVAFRPIAFLLLLGCASGCGTTRMTDTQRTATEQLLVSNAVDQAVSDLNFRELAGKTVFFDPQYLDGTVDRGYVVSSLRQQLLACGCILQEDRTKASYVVEARSGAVGTDRHALLIGIPQMNMPGLVPGQPSQIPEIPFAKKTDQEGVAKIAVFAYNRVTGKPIWQSGVVKAMSTAKDTWLLGAGPFQNGTIRKGTEFAGEELPIPAMGEKGKGSDGVTPAVVSVNRAASWPEDNAAKTDSKRLARLLTNPPAPQRSEVTASNRSMLFALGEVGINNQVTNWPWSCLASEETQSLPGSPVPPANPSSSATSGGQAETEPSQMLESGMGAKTAGAQGESEPNNVLEAGMTFKEDPDWAPKVIQSATPFLLPKKTP